MSRGKRNRAAFALVAATCGAVALAACGSDGDGAVGLGAAGCLSDQQICQFKEGVSTKEDVQKALGNAQIYLGSTTWVYLCQLITSQVVRNDEVIFDFDDSGVLSNVQVLRLGTASTPPPDCNASGAAGAPNSTTAGLPGSTG